MLTDNLLQGQDGAMPTQFAEEEKIVRALHRVIAPEAPLDAGFQTRLMQSVSQEWNHVNRRRTHTQRIGRSSLLSLRVLTIAATFVFVFAAIILSQFEVLPITGTVADSGETGQDLSFTALGGILAIVAVLLGAFFFYITKRR